MKITVQLACGHTAEVDHVRGDRRIQCTAIVGDRFCEFVSCVHAEPQQAITYTVSAVTQ